MYKIHEISANSAQSTEQMGTKYKFWYFDPDYGLTLFKEGRPGTGENWAEKISCELAYLIDMPHAHYELAMCDGKDGVICPALVANGARLIHGNEVLATVLTDYGGDLTKVYQRRDHTIRRVLSYFKAASDRVGAPYGARQDNFISTALDFFIGYLMFDAWIANQDRHDENWGLLRAADGNSFLAPSYDHGSSLGRNETDARRQTMLTTRDKGQHVNRYVQLARSALFPHGGDASQKALLTLEAFSQAAKQSPKAANAWRERLRNVDSEMINKIFSKIPPQLMTVVAKDFTKKLLDLNRDRILECEIEK